MKLTPFEDKSLMRSKIRTMTDCLKGFGIRIGIDMPEDIVMTVQDRAYTSPIWYTP